MPSARNEYQHTAPADRLKQAHLPVQGYAQDRRQRSGETADALASDTSPIHWRSERSRKAYPMRWARYREVSEDERRGDALASLMNLRPWRLYTKDVRPSPARPDCRDARGVMKRDPNHPALTSHPRRRGIDVAGSRACAAGGSKRSCLAPDTCPHAGAHASAPVSTKSAKVNANAAALTRAASPRLAPTAFI